MDDLSRSRQPLGWLGALAVGAGLMYLLDPGQGRRRRARVRDVAVRLSNRAADMAGKTSRDLGNRSRGMYAGMSSLVRRARAPDSTDEVLIARVRSRLGRLVSHPHALHVTAENGRVILEGPILEREVSGLINAVSSVRGVTQVENRLETHETAAHVPALQGGRLRQPRAELLQENWSPAARVLAVAAGGVLMFWSAISRAVPGRTLGLVGLALFLRGATNRSMRRASRRRSGNSGRHAPEMFSGPGRQPESEPAGEASIH